MIYEQDDKFSRINAIVYSNFKVKDYICITISVIDGIKKETRYENGDKNSYSAMGLISEF